MKNEIRVKHGQVGKIAKEIGCSRMHAKSCLMGIVDSDLSTSVRELALKKGGVKVPHNK